MANPREKNLLEALRSAGEARVPGIDDPEPKAPAPAEGTQPEGVASPPPGGEVQVVPRTPTSSLPGDTAEALSTAEPGAGDLAARRAQGTRAVPTVLVWATALGLAFVVGLVVGRQTRSVEAAPDDPLEAGRLAIDPAVRGSSGSRRDPIRREATPPASQQGSDTAGDPRRALFDEANQFTLVIANYGKTRDDFAWATHDHLLEKGVSVFPPVVRTDDILVLAGATPTVADLRELEELVHGLVGWNGNANAYADAYVAPIDDLIKR